MSSIHDCNYGIRMDDWEVLDQYGRPTEYNDHRFNGSEWYAQNGNYADGIRGVERTLIYENTNDGIYIQSAWVFGSKDYNTNLSGRKLIRQCDIFGNGGYGINIASSRKEWDGAWDEYDHTPIEVSNCLISNNDKCGIYVSVDGNDYPNGHQNQYNPEDGNVSIWNNVICDNGLAYTEDTDNDNAAGVYLNIEEDSEGIPSVRFMHNTVWANTGYGVAINGHATDVNGNLFDDDEASDPDAFYNNIIGNNGLECLLLTGDGFGDDIYIYSNGFLDDTYQTIYENETGSDVEIPMIGEGSNNNVFGPTGGYMDVMHITPGIGIIGRENGSFRLKVPESFGELTFIAGKEWDPGQPTQDPTEDGRHMSPYMLRLLNGGNPAWGSVTYRDPLRDDEAEGSAPDFGAFGGALAGRHIPLGTPHVAFEVEGEYLEDYIFIYADDININWLTGEYYRIMFRPPGDIDDCVAVLGPGMEAPPGAPAEQHPTWFVVDEDVELRVAEIDSSLEICGSATSKVHFSSLHEDDPEYEGPWEGFTFTSDAPADVVFDYFEISGANTGLNFTNAGGTGSDRIEIKNTTIDDCGTGVYINNSRVEMTGTTVSNSSTGSMSGTGVYMTNCSAGKVIMDDCTITDNGTDGTYSSAGITLSSSDPEIINCTIEDNSGAGITCYGSSPDLNAYGITSNNPNTIQSNGGLTQSGSDGAEIYLTSSSYPDVNYNNIVDYSGTSPIGYMIYKDGMNNVNGLDAENNYWGATPSSSFFYWGTGVVIDYDPYSLMTVTSVENYEIAMSYWEDGEFEDAAYYFELCLSDTGRIGINSVRYLTGCVGEIEDGDFDDLRGLLQEVADDQADDRVAWIANRYATHCLTEQGEYEDAMEEYDDARLDADNIADSIMAIVDYLAVSELAGGNQVDAVGRNIPQQMSQLLSQLGSENGTDPILPKDFVISQAYPNPFNSHTTIRYNLKEEAASLRVAIHDLQGREVAVLHNGNATAGIHEVSWNAVDVPSGLYLCHVNTEQTATVIKLMLLK